MRGGIDWTPQRLAWSALLMAWGEPAGLVERFRAVTDFLQHACRHWKLGSSYEGWVAAQLREQQRLVPLVIQRLRQAMKGLQNFQQCGRWEAYAVDGTDQGCPRTLANQQAMGDTGKPDGMPLVTLTTLLHLRLGLPWSFRIGPATDSERTHLRDMLPELPVGSLLVADAGFIGYELCCTLVARKQHFLLRVGGNVHLLSELGYESEVKGTTVYLWPVGFRKQPPLKLRLIVIRDGHKQPVYLVTSVLDPNALTDAEAAEIYAQRWGIEVFYRTAKQTLEHPALRSRTPINCYLELTWIVLGVWLLKLMTLRQVVAAGHDPRQVSPAQARTAVRRVLRNQRPCHRTRRSLSRILAECRLDTYVRQRPKASRNYPRKKHQRPPGPPIIKLPTEQERQAAKHLTPITIAS